MHIIILILLIIPSLILLYILFIPISIYLRFNNEEKLTKGIGINLFPFKLIIEEDNKVINFIKRKISEIKFHKKEKKSIWAKHDFLQILIDEFDTLRNIITIFLQFITGIFKSPDRNYLNVSISGGLSSPDITGMFSGLIESFHPLMGESISIVYHPDFCADSIKGDISIGIVVRINRLLKEILFFICRIPKIKIIQIYHKSKKGASYANKHK